MRSTRHARLREETDLWWRQKLAEWKKQGRLRKDGTLKVDTGMRHGRPDLTPQEIRALIFALPPKSYSDQKREVARMRGRRTRSWRRRYDGSEPKP